MCSGIAVSYRDIPETLNERHNLQDRVIVRSEGAEREVRFLLADPCPLLPAWWGNQFCIFAWGNRDNKKSKLPKTGWCKQENLEEGQWAYLQPEPVVVPATFGLEKGVWFKIKEGLRGILVRNEQGRLHVYLLTVSASHYYQVMTRHNRMPVLIGETI